MAIKRQSNFSEKEKNSLGKDLFTPDKNWQTNNYLIDNEQIIINNLFYLRNQTRIIFIENNNIKIFKLYI